jgi:hypothetical protein
LNNTPGCQGTLNGVEATVTSYGAPFGPGYAYSYSPTIAQFARRSFNGFIANIRTISNIPCTGNDETTTPGCIANALLTGQKENYPRWAAMTLNYLRVHGRIYEVNTTDTIVKDNKTIANALQGLWFTKEPWFTGDDAFQRFFGYNFNASAPTQSVTSEDFIASGPSPKQGDNSFLRAQFFTNPYIMLPLCRREADPGPNPQYGITDMGKVTPIALSTFSYQLPSGSFATLNNISVTPNAGLTQYQLFEQSSVSCVDNQSKWSRLRWFPALLLLTPLF